MHDLENSIEMMEDLLKGCGHAKHPDKWKSCVGDVKKEGDVDSPEAVCTASLDEESFKKSSEIVEALYNASQELLKAAGGKGYKNEFEEERKREGRRAGHVRKMRKDLLVTETIDILYDNSPMPRPMMTGDLPEFSKRLWEK